MTEMELLKQLNEALNLNLEEDELPLLREEIKTAAKRIKRARGGLYHEFQRIDDRGRLVIPLPFRVKLGLKPRTLVSIELYPPRNPEVIVIRPRR